MCEQIKQPPLKRLFKIFPFLLFAAAFGGLQHRAIAQLNTSAAGANMTNPNGTAKDTTHSKTNTNKWKDEDARISFFTLNDGQTRTPDTSISSFHRRNYLNNPWLRDQGNTGSPVNSLWFESPRTIGPDWGYHVLDAYRFDADSIRFYNTNRPYTVFNFMLGSKLEQIAGFVHSQNIRPNWNFQISYTKTNSPGFYKTQRNNHDNMCLATNYQSLNRHYSFVGAFYYNKEQHDENGGVVNDSELNNDNYTDRKTVDVAFQNNQFSLTRSPVTNVVRDVGVVVRNKYIFGKNDTIYTADSTGYTYQLKPKFGLAHQLKFDYAQRVFKDLSPDSTRYADLFTSAINNGGSVFYIASGDSVINQQRWNRIENRFVLEGYLGKKTSPYLFTAGFGSRYDELISDKLQTGVPDRQKILSNFLFGNLSRLDSDVHHWKLNADALFYLTGDYAGNFNFDARLTKQFGDLFSFKGGFSQCLQTPSYAFTHYENNYTQFTTDLKNNSCTELYGSLGIPKYKLYATVRNKVMANYAYFDSTGHAAQYTDAFNVLQVSVSKTFKFGHWFLYNEVAYQKFGADLPLNLPAFMGRHQLSYESRIFKNALQISTGLEAQYHDAYFAPGYNALISQFYYQHSYYVSNIPELRAFLNFRIKHFRAYVMVDQIQQLFANNNINFAGTRINNFFGNDISHFSSYVSPNTLLRFGFSWVMVN